MWASEILFAIVFHDWNHLESDTDSDWKELSKFGKEVERKKAVRMAWSATWRGPQVVTGALRKSAATGRESSNGHAQERLRTRRSARPVGVNQGEAATPVWWRPCELRS